MALIRRLHFAMTPIVTAENLSRFYGLILGLNNVSFGIEPGITGVVGPNGAGKTTLFRLLTGQIQPSSGSLTVFGSNPWNNPAVRAQLAYCPESETVPAGLRAREWLTALAQLSGYARAEAVARAGAALARVKLPATHQDNRVTTLSKGMRQRVKLAQCLLHDPRLIILDEPMNGLDPMGREELSQVLRQLAAQGTSIIISSHILHDLEALCRDYVLLRWGRVSRGGLGATPPGSDASAAPRWPEATSIRCADPERLARFLLSEGLLLGCEIDPATETLHVRWRDPARFYGRFHEWLLASGVPIFGICARQSSLESAVQPSPSG